MKKGNVIVWKNREEIIIKASNNRATGEIITNRNTYSTDYIYRQLDFGFIKIK